MDQLEREAQEDIRRTDVLLNENDIETTGNYTGEAELHAAFTKPQEKCFLGLIQGVDILAVRLESLCLNQVIETRNFKYRQYQWQCRLFKTANRTREHAHSTRRAVETSQERRGERAGPGSDDDTELVDGCEARTESGGGSAEPAAAKAGNDTSLAAMAFRPRLCAIPVSRRWCAGLCCWSIGVGTSRGHGGLHRATGSVPP